MLLIGSLLQIFPLPKTVMMAHRNASYWYISIYIEWKTILGTSPPSIHGDPSRAMELHTQTFLLSCRLHRKASISAVRQTRRRQLSQLFSLVFSYRPSIVGATKASSLLLSIRFRKLIFLCFFSSVFFCCCCCCFRSITAKTTAPVRGWLWSKSTAVYNPQSPLFNATIGKWFVVMKQGDATMQRISISRDVTDLVRQD